MWRIRVVFQHALISIFMNILYFAGVHSSMEVKAIQAKYQGKGLVYEACTGKWRTIAHVVCTTRAMPLSRVKYQLRTSFSFKSHETALRKRDAALMLL